MLSRRPYANPAGTELGQKKKIEKIGTPSPNALFQIILKLKYLRDEFVLQHLFQPALGQNKKNKSVKQLLRVQGHSRSREKSPPSMF